MSDRLVVCMDQRNHVLKRPDMYMGDVEVVEVSQDVVVADATPQSYTCRHLDVICSPALLKCFDEAIVNAIDNQHRGSAMKNIRVMVHESGELEVSNDGPSVPVTWHEDAGMWSVTVAFSQFLSGTNFNDDEVRFTGGRNGVGIKATNTWSTFFEVEVHDPVSKKHFRQRFEDNMAVCGDPVVRSSARKSGLTRISWMPDYARMGMPAVLKSGLPADVRALIEARVYDICACTHPGVNVFLNGDKIGIKSMQQYAKALGISGAAAYDSVEAGGRVVMQVCATARAEGAAAHLIGFVNGVKCSAGTHMDTILRRIADVILARARVKSKNAGLALKPLFLRQELTLVVCLLVPNPRFTSQSKETLATAWKSVGFTWEPSAAFKSALQRSPLVDRVIALASSAEDRALIRGNSAPAHRHVPRIHKYDPATGLFRRGDCSLIVTEGDSAKALAVAGLSVVGRESFGVFPLRGKLMNVTKFTAKKVLENAEISNLMAILGLSYGTEYTAESAKRLPYRRLVIFADQDTDGSHIAGLLINFLHAHYRSLMEAWPDFVQRFATPIVRARVQGADEQRFFSLPEYDRWLGGLAEGAADRVKVKYYKGLGTSNNRDAKDYFGNWGDHVTDVVYTGPPCDQALHTFFDEKKSAERKLFLSHEYDPQTFVDYGAPSTTIKRFLHDEMGHFSYADNVRSIPSAIDGLKPVQRKVLFSFFAKKQTSEVKVAQAGAMVAEMTAYHHGEVSIAEAIVGLAQDHTGTNNLALLCPEGQFGSRHNRPSEHAAPRYIFTKLDPVARLLFRAEDDPVLERMVDDGHPIEPTMFVPVIPLVLVNGASGIGTGWSTSLPNHNPKDVLQACVQIAQHLLSSSAPGSAPPSGTGEDSCAGGTRAEASALVDEAGAPLDEAAQQAGQEATQEAAPLLPWYAGFKGSFAPDVASDKTFVCSGVCEVDSSTSTVTVTELPVGRWTEEFIAFVNDKLVAGSAKDSTAARFVRSVENLSTDVAVIVRLRCFTLPAHEELAGLLKLTSRVGTANIHLFDSSSKLRHFDVPGILEAHADARLALYRKRRLHDIEQARADLRVAQNKHRFVLSVVDGSLELRRMSHTELEAELDGREFDRLPTFAYLTQMSITSMTVDRLAALEAAQSKCRELLQAAEESEPVCTWLSELQQLSTAIDEYYDTKEADKDTPVSAPSAKRKAAPKAKGAGRGKRAVK